MPEVIETQQVNYVDPLGGFELPKSQDPLVQQAPVKQAEAAVAEPVVTPEVVDTPAAPAEPEDPLKKILMGIENPQPDNPWDDSAKSLFKNTFGEEDPIAYRDRVKQVQVEYDLAKKDAEEGRNLKAGFGRLSPAAQRALQLEMEGKDSISYLRSLPDSILQNKDAKELSDKSLLDTYKPGLISKEEWDAKETGNYEDLNIDQATLDYKIKALRPLAEMEHQTMRDKLVAEVTQREQDQAQFNDSWNRAIAASVASAQADPILKTFAQDAQTIEAYRTGQLDKGLLTLDDGITPSPNKLTTLLKAQLFDKVAKIRYELGYEKGRQAGLQEGTSRMPAPTNGQRAVTSPQKTTEKPAIVSYLDKMEQSAMSR